MHATVARWGSVPPPGRGRNPPAGWPSATWSAPSCLARRRRRWSGPGRRALAGLRDRRRGDAPRGGREPQRVPPGAAADPDGQAPSGPNDPPTAEEHGQSPMRATWRSPASARGQVDSDRIEPPTQDFQARPRLPGRTNDLSVSVSIRGFGRFASPRNCRTGPIPTHDSVRVEFESVRAMHLGNTGSHPQAAANVVPFPVVLPIRGTIRLKAA
jgi:hypothetical protein